MCGNLVEEGQSNTSTKEIPHHVQIFTTLSQ